MSLHSSQELGSAEELLRARLCAGAVQSATSSGGKNKPEAAAANDHRTLRTILSSSSSSSGGPPTPITPKTPQVSEKSRYFSLCTCVCVCLSVSVCVRQNAREKEKGRVCGVCLCVCVWRKLFLLCGWDTSYLRVKLAVVDCLDPEKCRLGEGRALGAASFF